MRSWSLRLLAAGLALGAFAPTSALAYNGSAAAQYADTYALTYNSAYPSFANSGGDCTNFVSQALYGGNPGTGGPNVGGLAMRLATQGYSGNAAWYIVKTGKHGSWSYAAPWVNAQDNSIFLHNDPKIGAGQIASAYGLGPGVLANTKASQGDVVYYDWTSDGIFDHESIITAAGVDSNGTGTAGQWDLVDAHTNNRYHQYWTLAGYNAYWQTTTIDVFHIPSTAQ